MTDADLESDGAGEASPEPDLGDAEDTHQFALTREPTRVDSLVAALAALVAVATAGYGSVVGLTIAIAGTAFVALALTGGNRRRLDVGCLTLFVGVVVGGSQSGSVEATLVGTAACVVAWDLGQCAIDLGEQLGREAETIRLEAVHVISSVLVALVTVTLGYGLYVFAADGQPIAAVVLLLVAAALVTIGLGQRYDRSKSRSRSGSRSQYR